MGLERPEHDANITSLKATPSDISYFLEAVPPSANIKKVKELRGCQCPYCYVLISYNCLAKPRTRIKQRLRRNKRSDAIAGCSTASESPDSFCYQLRKENLVVFCSLCKCTKHMTSCLLSLFSFHCIFNPLKRFQ